MHAWRAQLSSINRQPFRFEGSLRMRLAEEGLGFLSSTVDTLIVIPNQNLFQLVDKQTSLLDSFRCAVRSVDVGVKCRCMGAWTDAGVAR